jgi:hypothetical protein
MGFGVSFLNWSYYKPIFTFPLYVLAVFFNASIPDMHLLTEMPSHNTFVVVFCAFKNTIPKYGLDEFFNSLLKSEKYSSNF